MTQDTASRVGPFRVVDVDGEAVRNRSQALEGSTLTSKVRREDGKINWDLVVPEMGLMPDEVLANRYGLKKITVAAARKDRGIPSWRSQQDPKDISIKSVYGSYRNSAKQRNLEFSLSFEEAKSMFTSACFYCGSPPSNTYNFATAKDGTPYKNRQAKSEATVCLNGIDRRNNLLGYTTANSVPACKFCNFAKNNASERDFLAWIERLVMKRQRDLDRK